jgi:hypothetical protein
VRQSFGRARTKTDSIWDVALISLKSLAIRFRWLFCQFSPGKPLFLIDLIRGCVKLVQLTRGLAGPFLTLLWGLQSFFSNSFLFSRGDGAAYPLSSKLASNLSSVAVTSPQANVGEKDAHQSPPATLPGPSLSPNKTSGQASPPRDGSPKPNIQLPPFNNGRYEF